MDNWWETKGHENVWIIIIFSMGLVSEDGAVMDFHSRSLENRWLKYNDCIHCGHYMSEFSLSVENGWLQIEKKKEITTHKTLEWSLNKHLPPAPSPELKLHSHCHSMWNRSFEHFLIDACWLEIICQRAISPCVSGPLHPLNLNDRLKSTYFIHWQVMWITVNGTKTCSMEV